MIVAPLAAFCGLLVAGLGYRWVSLGVAARDAALASGISGVDTEQIPIEDDAQPPLQPQHGKYCNCQKGLMHRWAGLADAFAMRHGLELHCGRGQGPGQQTRPAQQQDSVRQGTALNPGQGSLGWLGKVVDDARWEIWGRQADCPDPWRAFDIFAAIYFPIPQRGIGLSKCIGAWWCRIGPHWTISLAVLQQIWLGI